MKRSNQTLGLIKRIGKNVITSEREWLEQPLSPGL